MPNFNQCNTISLIDDTFGNCDNLLPGPSSSTQKDQILVKLSSNESANNNL